MKTKVKVFQTSPLNQSGRIDKELEEQINEWLEERPNVRVVNVQTTSLVPLPHEGHTSGSVVCMVFYADSASEGEKRAGFLRE